MTLDKINITLITLRRVLSQWQAMALYYMLPRETDGKLPAYAWPGGYPIYYLAEDNGVLCTKCANDYTPDRDNEEQLRPVIADINWEDAALHCENCNARIESAYAEDKQDE